MELLSRAAYFSSVPAIANYEKSRPKPEVLSGYESVLRSRAEELALTEMAASTGKGTQRSLQITRVTKREDLVRLIPLGREFHNESRYAHVPFSEVKFLRVYERMVIKPETTFGLYVERDAEIVGAMSAEIGDYFLGVEYPIATNHFVYVSGRLRGTAVGGRIAVKLMRLFMEWAKENGARELNMHVTSGVHPARTDSFIKKIGLAPYGGNYAAVIGPNNP